MIVGFTGTRQELAGEQHRALCHWVRAATITEFHHGCCIGADGNAFDVVQEYGGGAKVVAHPPTDRSRVSGNTVAFSDEVRPALPYLDRNRAIVNACKLLLVCPKGEEEWRSGTWSTVRAARKRNIKIVFIWPDGSITQEN